MSRHSVTCFALAALAAILLPACTAAVPATPAAESLGLLVYGASGKVGRQVVDEALARGHRVTAVSRDPSRIARSHPNLLAARGDLLDPGSVAALMPGHDVVIVSVRGVSGEPRAENTVVYRGAKQVVEALRTLGDGAPRLIHVGGSGSLEEAPGVLFADRLPKIFLPKGLELEIQGQILVLEYLRGVHDLAWTYVTPPKNLTNGRRTGRYRLGGDAVLEDGYGRSRLSRADFAVAILDEAERAAHAGQRISVAY